ncbi:hypothetical protein [Stutzerimonas nitrititolerans]|uniref:hypothetical protein n=1 Tax=Stutzerimonas nitrititolerans TaxID=2482751 RepID=UPI0028A1EFBD|nr:hypothetical protein [Stutzerimonas nitrititolerans]
MSLTGNCDSTQYCSHGDRSRENFAGTRKNIDGHAVSPELNTSKGGADKKVAGVDKVVRALTCGVISICVTERATLQPVRPAVPASHPVAWRLYNRFPERMEISRQQNIAKVPSQKMQRY